MKATTTTASLTNVWNGITIPDVFEMTNRPNDRRLRLGLSDPVQRRKWELNVWADLNPARVTFDVVCVPRDHCSKERLDFSAPFAMAARLMHPRASLCHNSGISVKSFRHAEGLLVIDSTLRTLAEQLKGTR